MLLFFVVVSIQLFILLSSVFNVHCFSSPKFTKLKRKKKKPKKRKRDKKGRRGGTFEGEFFIVTQSKSGWRMSLLEHFQWFNESLLTVDIRRRNLFPLFTCHYFLAPVSSSFTSYWKVSHPSTWEEEKKREKENKKGRRRVSWVSQWLYLPAC